MLNYFTHLWTDADIITIAMKRKKSRIQETQNLPTNADSRGGGVKVGGADQ